MKILYKKERGFSLIEIIIVMAVVGVIISFGMITDLSALRSDTLQAEESKIVSLLTKARSRAMANFFESSHGICYDASTDNYVIFQGSTCNPGAPTSELIPANINIAENPNTVFPSIVFNQLTGNRNTIEDKIHIEDGIKSEDIKINNEGTINW